MKVINILSLWIYLNGSGKKKVSNSGKVVKQMEFSYTANENLKWLILL